MQPVNPNPARPIEGQRVVIAEHQDGVRPMPSWRFSDSAYSLTRWALTETERVAVATGADIWLGIHHTGAVQPVNMAVRGSDLVPFWPDEAPPSDPHMITLSSDNPCALCIQNDRSTTRICYPCFMHRHRGYSRDHVTGACACTCKEE